MALWAIVAAAYGLILLMAALVQPIGRRPIAAVACLAYSLVALGFGTLVSSFWVQLFVPGGLLLTGYWLSGFFFRDPQPWLERFLLQSDRAMFRAARVDSLLRGAPRWVLEVLEASYASDYVVVGGGAIIAAFVSREAVTAYWSIVLAAELACYGALPWLRSRPPRVIEGPAVIESRDAYAATPQHRHPRRCECSGEHTAQRTRGGCSRGVAGARGLHSKCGDGVWALGRADRSLSRALPLPLRRRLRLGRGRRDPGVGHCGVEPVGCSPSAACRSTG